MSGSNDILAQSLLAQVRQRPQQSVQSRLAAQMLQQSQSNEPIYNGNAGIALRAGQGLLAGFLSQYAQRGDEEREARQLQDARNYQEQRDRASAAEMQPFLDLARGGGAARPAPAEAPAMPGPVAQAPLPPSAPAGDPSLPRGLRNNNPLNLSYVEGQPGVQGSDGRFGRYATPEDGIAASVRQLGLYGQRGLTTLPQIINRWAPPSENDTGAYVARVAREAGLPTDQPLNLQDPDVLTRLVGAMANVENGRGLDPAVARRGVDAGLALPIGAAANSQGGSPPPALPPPGPGQGAPPPPSPDFRAAALAAAASSNPRVQGLSGLLMQMATANERPLQFTEINGQRVAVDPRTGQVVRTLGASGPTETMRDETRTIGGRSVPGQVNTRTGQFSPYPNPPASTGDGPFAGTGMEAQINNIVLRVGPRVREGTATEEERALYQRAWTSLRDSGQVQFTQDPNDPTGQRQIAVRIPRDMGDLPPPDFVPQRAGGQAAPPSVQPAPALTTPIQQGGGVPNDAAAVATGTAPVPVPGLTREAAPPAGFQRGPNGALVPTPGGPQDPNIATLTEGQGRSNMFGQAMEAGNQILGNVTVPSTATLLAWRNAPESIVNMALNPNDQRYFNALRSFAAGILRKETGAAFTSSELLDVQSRFFPTAGDSPEVQAQKAEARTRAIEAMRAEMPGGRFRGGPSQPGPGGVGTAEPPSGGAPTRGGGAPRVIDFDERGRRR